jgi:hypothetical protein
VTGALHALAWVLAVAALGLLLVAPNANGPLLVLVWGVALVGFRFVTSIVPDRAARMVVGVVFLWGCFLAAFSGGWFLIPAGLAFLLLDWRSKGAGVAHVSDE